MTQSSFSRVTWSHQKVSLFLWCWHVYFLAADSASPLMLIMCCCAGEERIPDNEDIPTTENVVYGIKGE